MNCELSLRAPEPGDLDALYRWENDPCEWRATGRGPLSRQRLWQYIQGYEPDIYAAGELRLVIQLEGRQPMAVGCLDLTDFDPRARTAKMGIYVDPSCRRRSIATSALEALHSYCRDVVGMRALMALVADDNAASLALFNAAAYTLCGRLPAWSSSGRDILLLTHTF